MLTGACNALYPRTLAGDRAAHSIANLGRVHVEFRQGAAQRVAVHAQFFRGLALIALMVREYFQNVALLELADRLGIRNARGVHLSDKTIHFALQRIFLAGGLIAAAFLF